MFVAPLEGNDKVGGIFAVNSSGIFRQPVKRIMELIKHNLKRRILVLFNITIRPRDRELQLNN